LIKLNFNQIVPEPFQDTKFIIFNVNLIGMVNYMYVLLQQKFMVTFNKTN